MTAYFRFCLVGMTVTLLLAYPQLFYIHKYGIPWSGQDDFAAYHAMVLAPLRFDIDAIVFTMRQFTTILARGLLETGIQFPVEIWFEHFLVWHDKAYTRDIFFSLLLANFIGACVAGGLTYAVAARVDQWRRGLMSPLGIFAIMLLLLSGDALFYVLGPLTGAWSWAFAMGLFMLAEQRRMLAYTALTVLLLLSVFQRELLLLSLAGWAVTRLAWPLILRHPVSKQDISHWCIVLVLCLMAIMIYLSLRSGLFFAVKDPNAYQWQPGTWADLLVRSLGQWAMVASLFKLNLFGLWSVGAALAVWHWRNDRNLTVELLSLATVAVGLFAVSMLTNNSAPDRVIMTIAPLYALSLVRLGARMVATSSAASDKHAM